MAALDFLCLCVCVFFLSASAVRAILWASWYEAVTSVLYLLDWLVLYRACGSASRLAAASLAHSRVHLDKREALGIRLCWCIITANVCVCVLLMLCSQSWKDVGIDE